MNKNLEAQIKEALTILNHAFAEELASTNEMYADGVFSLASAAETYSEVLKPYLEAVTLLRAALEGGAA